MRPICIFLIKLVLPLAIIGCSEPQDSATTWDLSLPWGIQEFHTQNAFRFAEAVRIATDGRLVIKVHPGAILGLKGPETLRALEEGIVDAADMATFQQVGVEPILGLVSLPFLIQTQDDLRLLHRWWRPAVEERFRNRGLKILYSVPWPSQNIYTKTRIDGLAGLQGMRIRTYDKLSSDLMTRLGMTPIQLASPDVVPALASGAIDAVMTSTTTGAAQKYWEFLDYIYRTNHIWVVNILAVNLDSWNDLSPSDRQAVADTAHALEPQFWDVSAADDQDKLDLLVQHGIEAIEPAPELLTEMRAAAQPMWRTYAADMGADAAESLRGYLTVSEGASE